MMLKQVSWRRSNQALFLFSLLLVPTYLFSADPGASGGVAGFGGGFDPASILPQGFPGHEGRVPGEFYSQVPSLSARMVEACTRNMPPLLCGFFAYQQSPSSTDPRRQILSFNRLLLVGPSGTGKSETILAVAQKLGYERKLVKATSLRGDNRGATALNIAALFEGLRHEQARTVLIIDELHQLFEGYENHHTDHKENAVAFWQYLDDFEKTKPNIIIVGTVNRANLLPQELKSRFRVQYVYIGRQSASEWETGLEDAYDDDSDVEGGLDMASLLWIKDEKHDAAKKSTHASASAAAGGKAERDGEFDDDEPFDSSKRYKTINQLRRAVAKARADFGEGTRRDQQLQLAAAKTFAHRNERRTPSGKLILSDEDKLLGLMQLFDVNKILDYEHNPKPETEVQEERHKESMDLQRDSLQQQKDQHDVSMRQASLHQAQGIRANLQAQSRQKPQVSVGFGAGAAGAGVNFGCSSAPGITRETEQEIEDGVLTDEQRDMLPAQVSGLKAGVLEAFVRAMVISYSRGSGDVEIFLDRMDVVDRAKLERLFGREAEQKFLYRMDVLAQAELERQLDKEPLITRVVMRTHFALFGKPNFVLPGKPTLL